MRREKIVERDCLGRAWSAVWTRETDDDLLDRVRDLERR
jgi:hypothetical protein